MGLAGVRAAALLGAALAVVPATAQPDPSPGAIPIAVRNYPCGFGGERNLAAFASWFGRRPELAMDFLFHDTWANMDRTAASLPACWKAAGFAGLVIAVAPLPDKDPAEPTLAQAASGQFDAHYALAARSLVAAGFPDAFVRVGWEFNLPAAYTALGGHEAEFVAAYRRVVAVFRAVPGARFRFVWNPAAATRALWLFDPARAYPGDDVVDVVGLDLYNFWYGRAGATPDQRWAAYVGPSGYPVGLDWVARFAAGHDKPLAIPEWGAGLNRDGHAAGDDPAFVRNMGAWMAGHRVLFHGYWNQSVPNGWDGNLDDGRFPGTRAALAETFGGPR